MLKGLDPLLGPELLAHLRAMGHGDEIVIADANFPAVALAQRLERLDGIDAPRAVEAILSVLPLDTFVPAAAFAMAAPGEAPPILAEFSRLLAEAGESQAIEPLERFAFYERAKQAFAIVALYGNLILRKGVIGA